MHAFVVDEAGGSHGVRDTHLLQSIAHKPVASFGGNDLYADVFTKAAVLLEAIANYRVFVDGNKRTSLIAAARFLRINRYVFTASNKAAEDTIISVATKEMDAAALAAWLKQNSKKLKTGRKG